MHTAIRDELVLLSNSCICCTVRSDLMTTLARIHKQRERFPIDRVIVETTGLADPAPILHTLMADPAMYRPSPVRLRPPYPFSRSPGIRARSSSVRILAKGQPPQSETRTFLHSAT